MACEASHARPAVPARSTVLVGRDAELAVLTAAGEAGGSFHVVRGPAGIGKSRLARELAARTTAAGGITLTGRATGAGPAVPLRPLREAMLSASRRGLRPGADLDPFRPTLSSLVPGWGSGPAPPTESPLLLGEALLRLLGSWGRPGRAAVLVIDDLQWADPETVAVVDYLADNLEGSPVALVGTVRDGEGGPGTALADAAVRRRVARELVLRPLDGSDILGVANACLGGQDPPHEVREVLAARSEGVPFLVEELVAAAVATGWDSVAASVPGSVVASVALRLAPLATPARELLTGAALLGRHFDWRLAAESARLADDDAARHLRDAVGAQLVDVDGAGFRFRHALTREAVLAASSPADLAVVAARLLDVVAPPGCELTGEGCVLAASLAERLDRGDDAAAFLLAAARESLAGGALASADLLATRARAVARRSTEAADRLRLEAAALSGDTARARSLGHDLLAAAQDGPTRAELHLLLGTVELAAGRWTDAEDRAEAAVAADPTDPALGARAHALSAQAAMSRDDVDEALARARAALDGARATGQPAVECEALEVLGRIERGRDLQAAEAAFRQAHDLAGRAGLALWQLRALQELGTIDMFDSLDLDRLHEARRRAESLGALSMVALVDLQLSAVHDERAEVAEALAAARRCSELSRRLRLSTLAMSLLAEAKVHARRADRVALDEAVARARATGEDPENVAATVWGNVEPIYHLAVGQVPVAAVDLDRAMTALRPRPAGAAPFPGLWALLRTVLDEGGEAARAEVAALRFDTPVSRRTLLAAEAVALGRAGDPEGAAARFAEADAALRKHGFGLRHGLVRLVVAPVAHADGWGDPVGWLRGALAGFEGVGLDALAGRCRSELRRVGAPVPRRSGVADTEAVPAELAALGITRREVDVLALVAAGSTNRQVAERLVVSPRTVDKHVERLLQKTGVTRRDLADLARRVGLLRT